MKINELLTESTLENTVKTLDVTKFDLKDLLVAYKNAGYESDAGSFIDSVYSGFTKHKQHQFHIIWKDDDARDEDKPYAISDFYVYLGQDGKIECDSGGNPKFENLSEDEADEKLAKLKKS